MEDNGQKRIWPRWNGGVLDYKFSETKRPLGLRNRTFRNEKKIASQLQLQRRSDLLRHIIEVGDEDCLRTKAQYEKKLAEYLEWGLVDPITHGQNVQNTISQVDVDAETVRGEMR